MGGFGGEESGGGGWGMEGGESQVVERRDEKKGWMKGSVAARMEAQETV